MTSVANARAQLRILEELLELTPCVENIRPDVAALQQALDRRKHLLAELRMPSLDPGDDPDVVLLLARAQQIVAEIMRRDQAINAMLRDTRARLKLQLSRVGNNSGGLLPAEAGSWIA